MWFIYKVDILGKNKGAYVLCTEMDATGNDLLSDLNKSQKNKTTLICGSQKKI